MQNVVTLITDKQTHILDDTLINKAFMALERKGATIVALSWLAADEACDIVFDTLTPDQARPLLESKLEKYPVDIIVQPLDNRKKKLLVSDMDSTMIQQECIDEIADKLGLKSKVAAITERAMNGELDFKASLRERVALLKGLSESALEDVYTNHITPMPGAAELITTLRNNDVYCLLVSGGFTFFTDKIATRLGFQEHRANILGLTSGKLTGEVAEPILDKDSKVDALYETIRAQNISIGDTLAVGDGANDLPMLKAAGIGIAYHAKASVQEQVVHKINHTNLKSLLYIQGYKS